MTTVLGKEGDNFYTAFFEPDMKKREKALSKWVKKTAPSVKKVVAGELESFVEFIMKDRRTEEGWKTGEEKLRRIQPEYQLVMHIKLRRLDRRELENYKGKLPDSAFKKEEKPQNKLT